MATSFSANQYENAFKSFKLGNWQQPSNYKEDPRPMDGYTKIIANDRGHLKEGVPKCKANPWGNFVGTWDLPKQIPGNTAGVTTARTTYAQEKLQKEAEEANKVLGGSQKNQSRRNMRDGRGNACAAKPSLEDPTRSGAEAPGSKMFPDGYECSPAVDPPRQYTPLNDAYRYSPALGTPHRCSVTPRDARTPISPPVQYQGASPIPGVPDIPEVLAQGSREPTPEVERPLQGISAL